MKQILSLLIIGISFFSYSQDYFQQDVAYKIDVTLDDKNHFLNGNIEIEYTNNSNENLDFIWMHIWPNAYKNNNTAMAKQHFEDNKMEFFYASDKDRGYIDSLNFKINNTVTNWEYHPNHIDICKVSLSSPLSPGQKVTISTPFRVKIPAYYISRLGHVGESYQITQWYPKPAVFDLDGWHEMPYLSQGEFFSEYGSFDVSITLPKNYVLGATGDLQNEDEKEWLLDKVEETKKELGNKRKKQLLEMRDDVEFPASSKEMKTLRFTQDKVHDFAWFADKRYHVLKGEVELPHSKKKVDTWAMFTNAEVHLWKKSIEYLNDATYYYSLWNGDYPYSHVTAVDGSISAGGGMEYPNITVIGTSGNDLGLETVIVHEVGHNWFYGILGSNERVNPWMDEGLNTLNENRYLETKYPNKGFLESQGLPKGLSSKLGLDVFKNKSLHEFSYLAAGWLNNDQSIATRSEEMLPLNYGAITYSKTGITFDYLKGYLGDDLFDQCMMKYYDTWKFKHPQPKDIRKIFEEITGKDLSWFFDDMINTTKKVDFKVTSIKDAEFKNIKIGVKNIGEIDGPFSISGVKGDSIYQTTWYDKVPETGYVLFPKGDYDNYTIDAIWEIPEINRANNSIKAKGLTKRVEPLKLRPVANLDLPNETSLYFAPIMGYNAHDKYMLGMAFYNHLLPSKKFEYSVAPMFGFGSKKLVGAGNVTYNFRQKHNSPFNYVQLGADVRKYTSYLDKNQLINRSEEFLKVSPFLNFKLAPKKPRYSPEQHIQLRSTYIQEKEDFEVDNSLPNTNPIGTTLNNLYSEIEYNIKKNWIFSSLYSRINLEHGTSLDVANNQFLKLSLETVFNRKYNKRGKKVNVRLFGGTFLGDSWGKSRYFWQLDGQSESDLYGRTENYKYDRTFTGRNTAYTNMLSQQMVMNDGAFKTATFFRSSSWILASNIDLELPIPFFNSSLCFDYGYLPGFGGTTISPHFYNLSVRVRILREFDLYLPLTYSENINNTLTAKQTTYLQNIRFVFKLDNFDPFKTIRNFSL